MHRMTSVVLFWLRMSAALWCAALLTSTAVQAQITYRGDGGLATVKGCGSITPSLPAGTAPGDLLLAVIVSGSTPTISMPGWNQLFFDDPDKSLTSAIFWRISTGSDPNTVMQSGKCDVIAAEISGFTSVDTAQPFVTVPLAAGNWSYQDKGNNITTGTETTTFPGAMLVATAHQTDDATMGALTGYTQAYNEKSTLGNDVAISLYYAIQSSPGTFGPYSMTTNKKNKPNHGTLFALRPAQPPAVVSINRADPNPSNAATVSWTVIFSQSVTGVDASAFSLAASGVSGAFISTVTGSGATWTVTANTGIGAGTLGLNQTGPGSTSPALSGTFTGQVYTISATPALTEYRMDETGWSGAANEVVDTSGSYPGTAMNSANTTDGSRAIPGNPGTCRYGVFDNGSTITKGYVALPGFPNLNSDFTITAWIRTTNNTVGAQRVFIDDESNTGGYGLSLGEGGTGVLRFYSRGNSAIILDTPNVIANNTWYFVAGVADISNGRRWIYVYDAGGNLLPGLPVSVTSTGWGIDTGMASIGGETNASGEVPANFHFKGNIDEVRVYKKVLSQAALAALATQTHACAAVSVTPGGFNAYETSTAAGAITGAIRTKVAGSTVSVDVVALNTAKTAIQTNFTGTARVEILNSSNNSGALDANNCRSTWTTIQTLTPDPNFVTGDNGRKTISFTVPNAYRDARVRITYPAGAPTATGCSTDNFAIRPSGITVAVTDANWSAAGTTRALANTGASGGNVHKAGQPFTLTVTPSPGTTTNYDGSPTVSVLACTLPAVCANGTLSVGAYAGSGTRTSTTATYDEAGAFNLTLVDQNYAIVDAGDGTPADCSAAGRYVCQTVSPVAVGRFVPDHFVVTAVTQPVFRTFDASDAACTTPPSGAIRSFTYMGQFFGYQSLPVAMVTAQNAGNGTTSNYRGTLWKITSASVSQALANSPAMSLDMSQVTTAVLSETPGTGTGTLTSNAGDKVAIVRNAVTPQTLFTANLSLTWSVADSSENGANQGVISTSTPLVFNGGGSGIAFDGGGASSGKEFRYGRLSVFNANGSQLIALPVRLFAQYWNGTSFIVNTADNCTTLAGTNIEMNNFQGTLGPVAACKSRLPAAITFSAGRAVARLSAPGAGVLGSVNLTVHLEPAVSGLHQTCTGVTPSNVAGANRTYLQGSWSGAAYDQNPLGLAIFGVYPGNAEIIHMREDY